MVAAVVPCLIVAGLASPAARAASVESAVWSGAGSYTDPTTGQIYGKGGTATLTVTTTNDTKCVDLNRSWESAKLTQTSAVAKRIWEVSIAVPARAGTFGVVASASPAFNGSGGCTGSTPGNASVTASYIVDGAPPTVSGVGTPAANPLGWRNADTKIAWTATDSGSGIKTGPTPATDSVTGDTPTAGVTKTSEATDNVGNRGTGSLVVRLDKVLPSIVASRTPAPNGAGWNNSDVTVGFTCTDALSGIKSCTGGGSVVVSTEGTGQSVPGAAVDNADNENAAGVNDINIDKTTPTLSGAPVGAAAAGGWQNSDVLIRWTAADDRSGVAATPADDRITGEGAGLFATSTVRDRAGNSTSADSAKVNIDRAAPTTDATAPSGWTTRAQTVTLVGHDGLSGVASTHYILDGAASQTGTEVPVSGDGTHTLKYWSVDRAGNAEAPKTIEVKIDGSSPTISHTRDPQPVNGWNKSDVTVEFICRDSVSGIASCTPKRVVADEGADTKVTGTATDRRATRCPTRCP
jgi:hypothetical protein